MKSRIVFALAGALLLATGAAQAADAAKAQELFAGERCTKCHDVDKKKTGPALKTIAADAKKEGMNADKLVAEMKNKPKHKDVKASDADLKTIAEWILTL